MATVLDIGALEAFTPIFMWLFVWLVTYSLLEWTKWIGENKAIHALISFIVAVSVLLVPEISLAIATMVPWFVLLGGFLLLLLLTYKIFGATDADIANYFKTDRTVGWVILIIGIIIVVGSLSSVYGQKFLEEGAGDAPPSAEAPGEVASGSFSQNLSSTLFHPKILGMILIFLIAVITIAVMTSEAR